MSCPPTVAAPISAKVAGTAQTGLVCHPASVEQTTTHGWSNSASDPSPVCRRSPISTSVSRRLLASQPTCMPTTVGVEVETDEMATLRQGNLPVQVQRHCRYPPRAHTRLFPARPSKVASRLSTSSPIPPLRGYLRTRRTAAPSRRRYTSTRPPSAGAKATPRLRHRSLGASVGTNRNSRCIVRSTTIISMLANAAPGQRRVPPPNGTHE